MPTYDYRNATFHVIGAGMRTVKAHNHEVVRLLEELAEHDFFAYFPVNLITPCMYFPSGDSGCDMNTCEIRACRERDIPSQLLERDRSEYDFELDGWVRKDMPSDFTEYFDLRQCAPRDTGYNGARVWRFVHQKICFQKFLQQEGMGWKRDYNRFISGMHAVVDCEILADIGLTQRGLTEYYRRLRDEPGCVYNLYFAYMLTLCAIRDCRERLDTCSYLGDDAVAPLMRSLTGHELLRDANVQQQAMTLREHATSAGGSSVWKFRMRMRDLKLIMGCVECNICKVHGTVMTYGMGSTLQVLLGDDGNRGDPLVLDRVQLGALVKTAAKFGRACQTVEEFREFDAKMSSWNPQGLVRAS